MKKIIKINKTTNDLTKWCRTTFSISTHTHKLTSSHSVSIFNFSFYRVTIRTRNQANRPIRIWIWPLCLFYPHFNFKNINQSLYLSLLLPSLLLALSTLSLSASIFLFHLPKHATYCPSFDYCLTYMIWSFPLSSHWFSCWPKYTRCILLAQKCYCYCSFGMSFVIDCYFEIHLSSFALSHNQICSSQVNLTLWLLFRFVERCSDTNLLIV